MPNMDESNWSLGASTGSLGSTTPRLCTHRKTYHHGTDIMSPQQPSPSGDSATVSPTTSWSPRDRDRHSFQVDMAHIKLQPEIKPDLPCHPQSAREPLQQQGHPSSNYGDPTLYHRPVNEQLDNYMVIKQRSFHGYARSKRDLRQLPQTDPREDPELNPNWLHRSKTDIYIERRRAKLASQGSRRGGSGGYSLSGITLGSLMNQLPTAGKRDHNGNTKIDSRMMNPSTKPNTPATGSQMGGSHTGGSQTGGTRFPPLTLNRLKQRIQNDIETYSQPEHRRPSTTNVLIPTSSTTFPIPDAPPNSPPLTERDTPRYFTRSRLRKEAHGSIPLRIWEPSLDYVLRSDAKVLQPRSPMRSFSHQSSVRQQPSPLK
ncbi:uncharacterized protein [Asterias amurensis]|uniref:uncharacterized protein n=1 Tax=Asterias amurensis TaxID=7602 RepID=UPI003AB14762